MMRPEDEPLVSPVPFGGVRPPSPQVNPDPRMRGQVSRDPRGWRTTLPDISLGGATTPQPTPQAPEQPALPGSLDEFVPQTLPSPSVLPKYQGFTEEELALWEPLWMLSRGYTLPDDEFSKQLALMGYREQFRKEADLIAFDTYRKNLELRAQHDQRIRQLFAPLGQDFNTVFSSEAIQYALREVVAAYKASNPKISWNKLSVDAKRREILRMMQQGKLPTVKRFAEQWGRLKQNFELYKTLLDPADQMVVSELDGILGGRFEDFILKYLTLNDPEEEEQERQIQALRQQHLLYRQLREEFPDLYQNPQIGGGTMGGGGNPSAPSTSYGGGEQRGRGSGSGQGTRGSGVPDIEPYKQYLGRFLNDIKINQYGQLSIPFLSPNIALKPLTTAFTGEEFASLEETLKGITTTINLNRPLLRKVLEENQTLAQLRSSFESAANNLRTHYHPSDPKSAEAMDNFYAHGFLLLVAAVLLEAQAKGRSLSDLRESGEWSEIVNAITGTLVQAAQKITGQTHNREFVGTHGRRASEIGGAGGREPAAEYQIFERTGQRTSLRREVIKKAVVEALGTNYNDLTVREHGGALVGAAMTGNQQLMNQIERTQRMTDAKLEELRKRSEQMISSGQALHFEVGVFTDKYDAVKYLKNLANNENNVADRLSDQLVQSLSTKINFNVNDGFKLQFGFIEREERGRKVYKVLVFIRRVRPQQQNPQRQNPQQRTQNNRRGNRRGGTGR